MSSNLTTIVLPGGAVYVGRVVSGENVKKGRKRKIRITIELEEPAIK